MDREEIIVGDWVLDEPDYSGGKGRLFKGENVIDKRTAILRKFEPDGQADNEIQILRQAADAVDTPLYDKIEHEGERWLAREYLPGSTMLEILARTPENLVSDNTPLLFKKMVERVKKLHADGIIHGDIKPGHLVWDRDANTFRLIDYGASRFTEGDGPAAIRGTEGYTAPEVLAGQVTPSCDVFSLGMVAGVMLTGKPATGLAWNLPLIFPSLQLYHNTDFLRLITEMTDPLYTARPTMEEVSTRMEEMNFTQKNRPEDISYRNGSDGNFGSLIFQVILIVIVIVATIYSC